MTWYATEMKKRKELKAETTVDDIKVDLKLSSVKVTHANWVIDAYTELDSQLDVIRNGWCRSGMLRD